MSALANNFKKNFAGLLRGLLRKVDNGDAEPQSEHRSLLRHPAPGSVPHAAATAAAAAELQSVPGDPRLQAFPDQVSYGAAPARTAVVQELEMPLLPILEKLPSDLRSKSSLGGVDLQQATISVPVKKVLPQLALGAVKITFGELRNAAPSLFQMGEEYDSLPISLPLNEVLSRLNPALISRPPGQRTVAAPSADIAEPFGLTGHSGAVAPAVPKPATTHFYKKAPPAAPIKMTTPPPVAGAPLPFVPRATAPATPPPAAPPAPAAPQSLPFTPRATTPAAPTQRVNFNGGSGPAFQTPPPARNSIPSMPGGIQNGGANSIPAPFQMAKPQAPTPTPPPPARNSMPSMPGAIQNEGANSIPAPFQMTKPQAPTPTPPPAARNFIPPVPGGIQNGGPTSIPAPFQMAKPQAPTPIPTPIPLQRPAPAPAQEAPAIFTSLAALSEEWPETLRLEISQLNLASSRVALPIHLIETALRRGRVIFSWHHIRTWIRPTPPPASVYDATELELPLKVLAPLFLPTQKKEVRPQAKAETPPSSVPNLFFGFPQPQPEEMAPPVNMPEAVPLVKPLDAKLNDSNFYVWGENGEDPHLDETTFKRANVPATDFSSRRAMPQEIIERAMKLPGVTGAIIALPDGLKVACQLPSDLNADTVAAFLPQLFSRVGQCSKELRMGELNNLNFTLGTTPWKIFRVNAVYFAAFGVAGVSLPTVQLAMLAGELDRKK